MNADVSLLDFSLCVLIIVRWRMIIRARERDREKVDPVGDDGFLPLVSLLFRSKRSEILFILISRYFSMEKRQIFHRNIFLFLLFRINTCRLYRCLIYSLFIIIFERVTDE